jgi:hypothetical protein
MYVPAYDHGYRSGPDTALALAGRLSGTAAPGVDPSDQRLGGQHCSGRGDGANGQVDRDPAFLRPVDIA